MQTGTTTDFKKKIIEITQPDVAPMFVVPSLKVKPRIAVKRVNHVPVVREEPAYSKVDIESIFNDFRLSSHRDATIKFSLFKNFGIP
jgi:hypothetical protein